MNHDNRRITLISRDPRSTARDWQLSASASSRLVVLDSFTLLRGAVAGSVVEMDQDVERIVIDRCASSSDYLSLLANLPHEFRGDVLYIREDDSAFLSSAGRGGDRLIFALSATDLRFYMEIHGLVTGCLATEASPMVPMLENVIKFRAAYAA